MWAESEQSWGCSPMGSWAGSGEGLAGHGEDGPGRWPTRWAAVNASGTSGLLLLAEEEAEAMARLDGGGGTREAGGGARDGRRRPDLVRGGRIRASGFRSRRRRRQGSLGR